MLLEGEEGRGKGHGRYVISKFRAAKAHAGAVLGPTNCNKALKKIESTSSSKKAGGKERNG